MFVTIPPPTIKPTSVQNGPQGRFYLTPEGNKYPSITTVLNSIPKEALEKWRLRVGEHEAERISKRARVRGDHLHGILEDYIKGKPIDKLSYNLNVQNLFSSVKIVLDNNLTEVHLQETPIYSDILKCAGRLDLLGIFDGKLSLIDFKGSSKSKKKEWIENYFIQISFYAFAYQEQTGIPVKQGVVIVACEEDIPQIFRFDPWKYWKHLKKEIKHYHERSKGLQAIH